MSAETHGVKLPQATCGEFFATDLEVATHEATCETCEACAALFDEVEPTHPSQTAGIEAAIWALVAELQITNSILEDRRVDE